MGDFDLRKFATAEELAQATAREWLGLLTAEAVGNRPYTVALSGGRITTTFLSAAAAGVTPGRNPFGTVHFFWADERCVPPEDAESNFRLAREALFMKLRIPESQIHRVRGEDPPEQAARQASAALAGIADSGQSGQPVLDLIFLGMGQNGHVASLCPGEPEEVMSTPSVYRPIFGSPKPPPRRVTLGYPTIAAARQVWVLISGSGKEIALRQSLGADGTTPLARVLRTRGHTRVYTSVDPAEK